MSQYFPKPYEPFGGDINVKVDLSNYATKADIKNILHVDTSSFALKTNLANLKTEVDKLDIDKLVTVPDDLSKLSDAVKYIDTQEFYKLTADVFNARLKQANLLKKKTDFDALLSTFNMKISANRRQALFAQDELNKLKTFDSSYFIGKSHFEEDGTHNYLVFQPIIRYFKVIANTDYLSSCKSKGLSAESIKPPTTSDNSLTQALNYYGNKVRVKFTGSCLKQQKNSYTHLNIVNVYFVHELGSSTSHNNDPTLKNYLFGAVTLTKNSDIDEYGYSGYGPGFDRRSSFLFSCGGFRQNVLIFGVDLSSSAHIDNKKKDILVLGKGPTQGLEHTLAAEKMYSINFTVSSTSLEYNGINSYFFVNGTDIYKFKAKDSKIVTSLLCLGKISKDWSTGNIKKTGFTVYVYYFSVDYDSIAVDDIKDIHKYLMKNNDIV